MWPSSLSLFLQFVFEIWNSNPSSSLKSDILNFMPLLFHAFHGHLIRLAVGQNGHTAVVSFFGPWNSKYIKLLLRYTKSPNPHKIHFRKPRPFSRQQEKKTGTGAEYSLNHQTYSLDGPLMPLIVKFKIR